MKLYIFTIFFTLTTLFTYAQEEVTQEEDTSIKGQFDKIYRISTSYQTYKVISRDGFDKLKQNVLDSIKSANKLIIEKENLLKSERENIKKLVAELDTTKLELQEALKKENSISLLGISLNKTTYNLILWLIIIALALCLAFFIVKFSKSNVHTKKAQEDLLEIEQEFETHRKKSLEREQKLRRQLQDEINKHRNT